ncbi:unnamed protein product [Victoria cruziana]
MSLFNTTFLDTQLYKPTSIFGLHLWLAITICVGVSICLILLVLALCVIFRRYSATTATVSASGSHRLCHPDAATPVVSREIREVKLHRQPSAEKPVVHVDQVALGFCEPRKEIQIDIGRDHRIVFSDRPSSHNSGGESRSTDSVTIAAPEVSHLGWGHWYTLRELEVATEGFADENVIGEGGYGIVYKGVMHDGSLVAVKNLLNNRGQAEREFKVEVEAIGRVRHKNLVRLLGYCVEGAHRMLVYEYVDNGNLDQWLHGDVGPVGPLTWDIRMNVILGTAKGLAYLHEGLEPKVVHRDVKASNILLDQQWHPKVSDFGLAKLLGSERSYITTRVMGTFGYVAPEYASTGMLNERSDVYSFGVLIMEIISGRCPVDYSRPPGEVNLVEWLKVLVSNKNLEQVLDPKMPDKPSSKALKRALLVALRCVNPDAQKRLKMGHVIHMLEVDDFHLRDDRRNSRETYHSHRSHEHANGTAASIDKQPIMIETGQTEGERDRANNHDSRR